MNFRLSAGRACRAIALLFFLSTTLYLSAAFAQDAAALVARYQTLQLQLAESPFHRPLVLESEHVGDVLKGSVFAVHMQPFGVVAAALVKRQRWCDILMLHLNVKGCLANAVPDADSLSVFVGRKFDQPLSEAHRVDFDYRVVANDARYAQVLLEADVGPMGTSDYRIEIEAVPLDAQRTLVRMRFSHRHGMVAGLAMKSYLATVGRNKVGFSLVSRDGDGRRVQVGGERGVIERNTMRYYLALESYLGALGLPEAEQPEQRILDWHRAVERYPAQLLEMDRDAYLVMKRGELARQRARSAPRT